MHRVNSYNTFQKSFIAAVFALFSEVFEQHEGDDESIDGQLCILVARAIAEKISPMEKIQSTKMHVRLLLVALISAFTVSCLLHPSTSINYFSAQSSSDFHLSGLTVITFCTRVKIFKPLVAGSPLRCRSRQNLAVQRPGEAAVARCWCEDVGSSRSLSSNWAVAGIKRVRLALAS
jgi:hypothetical protein